MASYYGNYGGGGRPGFQINQYGYCIVYTDGCCLNNGQPNAQAGIGVVFAIGHPSNISQPLSRDCYPTSNNAEIQAATVAVETLKRQGYTKVWIRTDSDFLVKSMEIYMKNWLQNDWFNTDGSRVKNRNEFMKLNNALIGTRVEWELIPSHAGIPENELADSLAKQGARYY